MINDIPIEDTFAEAFPMKATRLLITAHTSNWALHAAHSLTGFATSVIGCGCEAGIEQALSAAQMETRLVEAKGAGDIGEAGIA